MLIMSAESGLSEYLITGKASTPPKYPWPDSILRRGSPCCIFSVSKIEEENYRSTS